MLILKMLPRYWSIISLDTNLPYFNKPDGQIEACLHASWHALTYFHYQIRKVLKQPKMKIYPPTVMIHSGRKEEMQE